MNLFKEKELEINFFKIPNNKTKIKTSFLLPFLGKIILSLFLIQTIYFINYSAVINKDYKNTLNSYQQTIDLTIKTEMALDKKNNDLALIEFVKLKSQSNSLVDIMSGGIIINILSKRIEDENLNKKNDKNYIEQEKLVNFYKKEWNSGYLKELQKIQEENNCSWIDLTCNMFLKMKKHNNMELLERTNKLSEITYYNVNHQKEYTDWYRKIREKQKRKEVLTIEDMMNPGEKIIGN